MSLGDLSRTPEHSRPASTRNPSDRLIGTVVAPDDDTQAQDAFLQHLVVKQPSYAPRYARKSNTNYTSSIGSVAADRTPSSLFELKQQRLLAAADRKKRIIARIVSIVGLLIILLCAAIVTLTLKMAPKIDELVRSKAGAHQLIHIVTRMSTSTMAPVLVVNCINNNNNYNNNIISNVSNSKKIDDDYDYCHNYTSR